ncbi:arsenate reductase family protein [Allomuricauda sp. CP2A]|jgi:arsenate reductase-like glutaredoxin family protein|uniref:arsenate reductase family protein n=1 Tax=Allomuricauda sp. CP2A TaxID=1848189 RepID=UPI0021002083|nr:hypothetical protein [Muricauda sp. CP2A]
MVNFEVVSVKAGQLLRFFYVFTPPNAFKTPNKWIALNQTHPLDNFTRNYNLMGEMGVISRNDREIKFYYSSATSIGKQTLGYVRASDKKVLEIDVAKTKVTATQWSELADLLNLPIKNLVNTEHPDFVAEYGKKPNIPDENDWLHILEKSPQVFQNPIILNGDKAFHIKTPSDVAPILDGEEQ